MNEVSFSMKLERGLCEAASADCSAAAFAAGLSLELAHFNFGMSQMLERFWQNSEETDTEERSYSA